MILDNLSSGTLDNLAMHKNNPKLGFVRGDITNAKDVRKSIKDADAVIHEAAVTSVPLSIRRPDLVNKVNVEGTKMLLEESSRADVKRFIYASSCAVYGEVKKLPIREDEKANPISPYGKSKLEAEALCKAFQEERGIETVCLRYFNVYGPRQTFGPYAGVILQFLERVNNNKSPIIFGDGKQTRDFVHVSDIVQGSLLALESDKAAGQVINIGTGTETSIDQLCKIILKTLGRTDLKPIYMEPKPGDIRHSRADITKAEKILDYHPKIGLEEGIKRLVKYQKLHGG